MYNSSLLVWLHSQAGDLQSEKTAINRFSSLPYKREFFFPKTSSKVSGFPLIDPVWVTGSSLIQSLLFLLVRCIHIPPLNQGCALNGEGAVTPENWGAVTLRGGKWEFGREKK